MPPLIRFMRLTWTITDDDVAKVRAFVNAQAENRLVKLRVKRNVKNRPTRIDRSDFWHGMIACLLTTQQKSGPKSAVTQFLNTKPFPLSLDICRACSDIRGLVHAELTDFGSIRFGNKIANQAADNIESLDDQYWPQVDEVLRSLIGVDDAKVERSAAHFIDHQFCGFGPKQARNLLQMLRLTRYEIPIDSRIVKWINGFGFQVAIDPASLASIGLYEALSDKIQELCRRAEIYPCVLDAAAFASFDGDGWDGIEEIIW
jgi:hypothetical protein